MSNPKHLPWNLTKIPDFRRLFFMLKYSDSTFFSFSIVILFFSAIHFYVFCTFYTFLCLVHMKLLHDRARKREKKARSLFSTHLQWFEKKMLVTGYGSRTMSARLQATPTSIHLHIHWVISKIDRNAMSFEWITRFFRVSFANTLVQWNFICFSPKSICSTRQNEKKTLFTFFPVNEKEHLAVFFPSNKSENCTEPREEKKIHSFRLFCKFIKCV